MLKIEKILVPVDFSTRSKAAVEHAVNVAQHFNAECIFLHAIEPVPYTAPYAAGIPDPVAWPPASEIADSVKERLNALVEEVAPGFEGERLIVNSDPASAIQDTVGSRGIDLLIMPTAGAGLFRRLVLGSVTTKVLNDVTCPVFTGAHMEEIETFSLRPYKKIACAIDLEADSRRVLLFARDFAAAYRATLAVVHSVPLPAEDGGGSSAQSELVSNLQEYLSERMESVTKEADAEASVIVEIGEPEESLPALLERENFDLLVIGRRENRGLLEGLRTHAYGIIRRAPCPVLSV